MNIDKIARSDAYGKRPMVFHKTLCMLNIKHNLILAEFHTYDHKNKRELDNKFGIYECVYCGKRIKKF